MWHISKKKKQYCEIRVFSLREKESCWLSLPYLYNITPSTFAMGLKTGSLWMAVSEVETKSTSTMWFFKKTYKSKQLFWGAMQQTTTLLVTRVIFLHRQQSARVVNMLYWRGFPSLTVPSVVGIAFSIPLPTAQVESLDYFTDIPTIA